jgi:hypothetical protein
VAQAAHLAARDIDRVQGEKFHLGDRAAIELFENLPGVGALNLIAVVAARHRLAAGPRGRTVVALHLDVELAGLAVELNPIDVGRAADEIELVLAKVKDNAVADHIAVMRARHELLGAVDRKIGEAVDGQIIHEFERIRPGDHHFGHVMRLIEQHRGLAPGELAHRANW